MQLSNSLGTRVIADGISEAEWSERLNLSSAILDLPYQNTVPQGWMYGYMHVDPATNWVFYVGIGRGDRCHQWNEHHRRDDHHRTLQSLRAIYPMDYIVRIYLQPSREHALLWEAAMIDRALQEGHLLYNRAMRAPQRKILGRLFKEGIDATLDWMRRQKRHR